MSQIGTLTQFTSSTTMVSADVNGNFVTCANAHNSAFQPFFGSVSTAPAASTTKYALFGNSAPQVSEKLVPMPIGVTLSALTVRLDGSQPNDGSLVVTVRKNGIDTLLSVTVTANAVAGTYRDTTDTVTFAAGDRYSLSVTNNSPTTASPMRSYSFLGNLQQVASPTRFAPLSPVLASDVNANFVGFKTGHESSRYAILTASGFSAGGPPLFLLPGDTTASGSAASWVAPVAGTLQSLYVYDGPAVAHTIYVNGVPTALTVTGIVGALTSSTGLSVSVNALDRIGLNVNGTSTPQGWSFAFTPAEVGALVAFTAGTTITSADVNANFAALKAANNAERIPSFVISALAGAQVASAATVFVNPTWSVAPTATETQAEIVSPCATTLRNLTLRIIGVSQPAGGNLVCTMRKNGADTAVTVTLPAGSAAGTVEQDTSNSVALVSGDRFCLKLVNNAATAKSAQLHMFAATFDL